MFLFLSKLLPLFIYPLGFATLMLIAALVTLWKRPRLSAVFIGLALMAILIPSNNWISSQLVRSLEWQNIPMTELPKADAIVILGGATRPQVAPRPWVDLTEEGDRIIYGVQLFRQGKASRLILSGGRIKWQANTGSESADMAAIAVTMGVPQSAILEDPTSLNTYENAVNVKKFCKIKTLSGFF